MSTMNFQSFKLRGESAVSTFAASAKAHGSGYASIRRTTLSARPRAANPGESTPTFGPPNHHLGIYFPHTLEPAA
jgi:hypothetical protein